MAPIAELFIHFAEYVTPTGNAPVVAEVLDSNLALAWRGLITLDGGRHVSVDTAGPYLVRAWLPNGELIASQAEAVVGTQTDVPLYPQLRSPQEDLAWAFYMQPTTAGAAIRHDDRGDEGLQLQAPEEVGVLRADVIYGSIRRDEKEYAGSISVETGSTELDGSHVLTLEGRRPTRLMIHTRSGQVWLRLTDEFGSAAIRGHQTWVAMPTIDNDVVEVLLTSDPIVGVRVNVRIDPIANALLGYVSQGQYGSVRALAEPMAARAEDALQHKRANPILATIAGYALLLGGDIERLHDWSFNLANWFPELPDGPVIAAWHVLRTTGSFPDAEKYFHQATDRGVPLFAAGLRLLFELGEIIASANPGKLDPANRGRVDRLRSLEAARQRWSSTTILRDVSPRS
jgi:hypothetical protein